MNRRNVIILFGVAAVVFIVLISALARQRGVPQGISDSQIRHFYIKAKHFKVRKDYGNAIINYEKVVESLDDPKLVPAVLYDLADAYQQNNQLLEARSSLRRILVEYPESDLTKAAVEDLGRINVSILFSPIETDESKFYIVQPGDSLKKIADKFNTSVDLIMKSNRLKNELIKPNMRLKISQATFSILVEKSQNKLTLKSNDEFFKVYSVSTGNNDLTPSGEFAVINKLENPVWYYDGRVISPESPENILGTRWLGLSLPKYGIHGTNDPASIGKFVTKGCIRLHNQDVEELYTIIPVRTKVKIVD